MFLRKATFFTLLALLLPAAAFADSVGQTETFFVDPAFDAFERREIQATVQYVSDDLYFYFDNEWWEKFGVENKAEIRAELQQLSTTFSDAIRPAITDTFGSEFSPGLDNDRRITILLHPMRNAARGYWRSLDTYLQVQAPDSNEREMLYFDANSTSSDLAPAYLAHEFMHLVTHNQKIKLQKTREDVWFQEMLSEYAVTVAGLNDVYEGSYLENRVAAFLHSPTDSLTEWRGEIKDYAVISLFAHYIVEQYGEEILVDALHSSKPGLIALNEALADRDIEKNMTEIFQEWRVAVLINDCTAGRQYCYQREGLDAVRVVPQLNFLPFAARSALTLQDTIKDWGGRWYKLVGGRGTLELTFDGVDDITYYPTVWVCTREGSCELRAMELDATQEGVLRVQGFGTDYSFIILMLSTHEREKEFSSSELAYPFTFEVQVAEEESEDEIVQALLDRIETLQAQIAELQQRIAQISAARTTGHVAGATATVPDTSTTCAFAHSLSLGLSNDADVRCLQEFLTDQGSSIYPEGLVTGNFLGLTEAAVIRFQEAHAADILVPLDLTRGTGFVGSATLKKIKELL